MEAASKDKEYPWLARVARPKRPVLALRTPAHRISRRNRSSRATDCKPGVWARLRGPLLDSRTPAVAGSSLRGIEGQPWRGTHPLPRLRAALALPRMQPYTANHDADAPVQAADSARPTVAVLRHSFLPYSETFIHDQLRSHRRYRPVVLARRILHPDRFGGHTVTAIENTRAAGQLASLVYGLTGRSRAFDSALRHHHARLIHAHFANNGAYAVGFAERHGLPLVVSLHGHDVSVLRSFERYHPESWFYMARLRRLFAHTTLFLAASEELATLIVEAGAPAQRVIVHRLGIDVEALGRLPRPPQGDDGRSLMMVGRFVEKKGHEFGLRAAGALRARGYRFSLDLVGEGPLKPQYVELIQELGLTDVVTFHGSLSHAEVLTKMAQAQVLMAPSVVARSGDRESGVMVVKEAGGLGLPVVGTRHGGIPEIIDDERTGLLVPERDAPALTSAVARLLDDGALRSRLGEAARHKMRTEYSLNASVQRLEELYDLALSRYEGR